MNKLNMVLVLILFVMSQIKSQEIIPFDTAHWEINATSFILENYKGKDAIYLQGGLAKVKELQFLNGTIEFDIYLTERRGFPGLRFRNFSPGNMEVFYMRPHMSGLPDATQSAPIVNGITPWQLYFGPSYSTPYEYNFDTWTHVKIVVHNQQAQVYFDYSDQALFSWNLRHKAQAGDLLIGGGPSATYFANFKVSTTSHKIIDFKPIEKQPIEGLIQEWKVSDLFKEAMLENATNLIPLIKERTWEKSIKVEEGTAANISSAVVLPRGPSAPNTVFAKITIQSDKEQVKFFEFGYSDRVVVILNNKAIYKGTNGFGTRDYRYLGTIGLFDGVYLDLEKGENTLLMAVSESFGGWLVTGKIQNMRGISIE